MTDHEAVDAMVARVIQEWGRIDVLVANAGGGRGRPVDTKASSLDPALLQLVTGMNLFGTVYTVNAVAPTMKQQRSGKIITVGSIAGTAPSRDGGYAHYGAAKAASPITRATRARPRAVRYHCELHRTRRDRDRPDHGDGDSRVASRAIRTDPSWSPCGGWDGRGLRQSGRVPRDRSVRLRDWRGDPSRWRAGAGVAGI